MRTSIRQSLLACSNMSAGLELIEQLVAALAEPAANGLKACRSHFRRSDVVNPYSSGQSSDSVSMFARKMTSAALSTITLNAGEVLAAWVGSPL